MKIDGSMIARAEARKKKNEGLVKENSDVQKDDVDADGFHIKAMMSLIDAIHSKDPKAAHSHISEYAKHVAIMDQRKAV